MDDVRRLSVGEGPAAPLPPVSMRARLAGGCSAGPAGVVEWMALVVHELITFVP